MFQTSRSFLWVLDYRSCNEWGNGGGAHLPEHNLAEKRQKDLLICYTTIIETMHWFSNTNVRGNIVKL